MDDIIVSLSERGYSAVSLVDDDFLLDMILTEEANDLFLYPERKLMNEIWKGGLIKEMATVFLSHSSKDKDVVDQLFDELQKVEVRVWYDKYEINPGDSISDKINEGLLNSEIGILILSKNFFDPKSGWPKSEMNYFLQQRMRSGNTNFICVNLDLHHDELPPLLQDYRYINYKDSDALDELVRVVRKKTHRIR